MDKTFFRIVLNTTDTIMGAFLGALLGISYYLNHGTTKALVTPYTAILIIATYFAFSIAIKDTLLRK